MRRALLMKAAYDLETMAPDIIATATAIACGNTAVLTASELCPATHLVIGEAFRRAGLPDGVMNVVTNSPEDAADVVSALIAAPEVRHVNFTGFTKVGRIIAQKAHSNSSRCSPGRSTRLS